MKLSTFFCTLTSPETITLQWLMTLILNCKPVDFSLLERKISLLPFVSKTNGNIATAETTLPFNYASSWTHILVCDIRNIISIEYVHASHLSARLPGHVTNSLFILCGLTKTGTFELLTQFLRSSGESFVLFGGLLSLPRWVISSWPWKPQDVPYKWRQNAYFLWDILCPCCRLLPAYDERGFL